MTYSEWLQEWLDNYVRITAKWRTVVRYSDITYKHICPKIGDLEICELTAIDLQRYITELIESGNRLTGKGLSSSAVNSIITVLQSSLTVAYGLGLIQENPATNIKRPKLKEKQVECFGMVEQKQIEQAVLADKRTYMLGVILCLYTGLRIGELLALMWRDVDFVKGTLFVTKTCYDGNDSNGNFGRIVDEPKTPSSRRLIPLSKQMVLLLKEIKKQSGTEWVISKNSKPLSVRTYQRNFASLLKKLRIPHRGFHALRHTFATRAIECGMDIKTLSEILGHKNATITLNRYAHSLMEHKRDMMNKLGRLYDLSQNK